MPPHSCSSCITRPCLQTLQAKLHDLSGFMMQVHGGIGWGNVIDVMLVELRGLIRMLADIAAGNNDT